MNACSGATCEWHLRMLITLKVRLFGMSKLRSMIEMKQKNVMFIQMDSLIVHGFCQYHTFIAWKTKILKIINAWPS